jgi:hypothetical protein
VVEAVLALCGRSACLGGRDERQGASEAWLSALNAAENAAAKRPPCGVRALLNENREEPRDRAGRSFGDGVNRLSTRGWIAARWSGAALSQVFGSSIRSKPPCVEVVAAGNAAGLGVERSSGARVVMLVAEVGERHLSGVVEVSREAHQEGAGVGRGGQLFPRQRRAWPHPLKRVLGANA